MEAVGKLQERQHGPESLPEQMNKSNSWWNTSHKNTSQNPKHMARKNITFFPPLIVNSSVLTMNLKVFEWPQHVSISMCTSSVDICVVLYWYRGFAIHDYVYVSFYTFFFSA